jgi:hypothetical protein
MLNNQYVVSNWILVASNCLSSCSAKGFPSIGKGVTIPEIKGLCLVDNNCNQDFFNLNNMCCGLVCCNYFDYVFGQSSDPSKIMKNFYRTIEKPRAINVIIALTILCLSGLFVSIVLSIFRCRR